MRSINMKLGRNRELLTCAMLRVMANESTSATVAISLVSSLTNVGWSRSELNIEK